MRRLIAIVIIMLLLGGAGWWGWTHPDALPGALRDKLPPLAEETAPSATDPSGPSTEAMTEPAQAQADPAIPDDAASSRSDTAGTAAATATEPTPTPAPMDAPLPAQTGSAMAVETERVAEAVIAAADSRARAEATARAEEAALDTARADLRDVLAPYLDAQAFDSAAMRNALSAPPSSDDMLVAQQRNRLAAQVEAILSDADRDAANAIRAAATGAAARAALPDSTPPLQGYDPSAQLARLRELLQ
ncbi:hypothetical protein FQV27_11615 [Paracoccus aurantiacus]|uniref:Uncharacterized protein n=1 Tax=Paracoccus aurantiacus TaxID=2599412 RepID=A0A5C6S204_9RHOB|nr:hypothetical protein [Paracoccus aurantiacus]TXB68629.1 hypothetical protein FQV27_11615 [Paracoccus aurantiacus]